MIEMASLFLCGDVMTGRGIDQILPHPVDPQLHERYVRDARQYVRLAERAHGEIQQPVSLEYIWGDALAELRRRKPEARIINLETAVTDSNAHWPGKGIHYRMHPDNLPCLTDAGIDLCSLANNHVLDWGYPGLEETLGCLSNAGIQTAGAGTSEKQAQQPARLALRDGRELVVFGLGLRSSGIPLDWAAAPDSPGVNLLPDLSEDAIQASLSTIRDQTDEDDLVLVSVHWGGNWGYRVPSSQRHLAQRLVAEAGVDVVHGHSSHHVKGIEVYRGRLILYGCGDFINDYEGISGKERFRGDLALMYFPSLDPEDGHLTALEMIPLHRRKMQLHHAAEGDARWLLETLNREGSELGTEFRLTGRHELHWVGPS